MLYRLRLGSITNAQRAKRVLLENGYHAYITRVENPTANDGCGYAVRLHCDSMDGVTRLLKEAGIRLIGADVL
ncbi:MAG: DUF3343 domain-containing protein [Eubacterium sp.]|nr:DUF3343 domain-containing protein [Eubacterium sp.]